MSRSIVFSLLLFNACLAWAGEPPERSSGAPQSLPLPAPSVSTRPFARTPSELFVLPYPKEKIHVLPPPGSTIGPAKADSLSGTDTAELIEMRLRLAELLATLENHTAKAAAADKAARSPSPEPKTAPPTPAPSRNQSLRFGAGESIRPGNEKLYASSDKPLDPMALGRALFRIGDYESALTKFRRIDLNTLNRLDRVAVQYLTATCMRKLGRTDEAAALYREIVNAKVDPMLVDCAQWQLSELSWRKDLEAQLARLR